MISGCLSISLMTVARKRKGEVEGGVPPLTDDYYV